MPEQAAWGEIEIAAPPATVFEALTDAVQLRRWFSEFADVSLADGRYDFWGHHSPDGVEPASGRVSAVEADPPESLSFRWSLFGCDSYVRYTLREFDGGTLLVVDHDGLAFERAWLLEMFWSMALENLRAWLERGEQGLRHDFSTTYRGGVRHSLDIDAAPDTVFAALVEPAQLARYMSDEPFVEAEPGGRYELGWGDDGPYRVLELDAPRGLSYLWRNTDGSPDTLVTWQLAGSAGRTRLTLVHSGFAADRDTSGYTIGWLDYLNRIRFMSEVGAGWRKPRIELISPEERAKRAELISFATAGVVGSAPLSQR